MDRRRFLPTYHYEDNTTGLLEDSVGKPLRDYKIYGNSIQDGTPSPETPVEIQSVGEKTINLSPINTIREQRTSRWSYINLGKLELAPGKYTVKCHYKQYGTPTKVQISVRNYDELNTAYGYSVYHGLVEDDALVSFTLPTTANGIQILLYINATADAIDADCEFTNIMLVEGAYTAETVPEYEPFGYKVPIKVSGKNLFDKNAEFDATRGVYTPTVNIDGEAVTCSHDGRFNMLYIGAWAIRTDGNTEFTVSAKNISFLSNGGYFYIREADEIPTTIDTSNMFGTQILMLTKNVNDYSYTLTTDKKYLFIICAPSNGGAVSFEELQIEYGETAMSYELYIEPQTANIYLTEPLRKVGDYADYVDFKNGCVVRNTQKLILDSSLNPWTYTYNDMIGAAFSSVLSKGGSRYIGLCTHSDKVQTGTLSGTIWCGDAGSTTVCWLGILDILGMDITEFKTWLDSQETPVEVICGRNTPTEEPLELPPIPTIKGTTTVTADTAVRPSEVMWQYYRR